MSEETKPRLKNRKIRWTWVGYVGTDLITVRRAVEEDYCHFNTKEDALSFIRKCEETKDFDDVNRS